MPVRRSLRSRLITGLDGLPHTDEEATRLAVLGWALRRWWPEACIDTADADGPSESELDVLLGDLEVPDRDQAGELLDLICERLGVGKVGKGAFHTPPALASRMALEGLAQVLALRTGESVASARRRLGATDATALAQLAGARVLDPACGGGALLVAARRWAPDIEVVGHDTDPISLRVASLRLGSERATLEDRDLLRSEVSHPPFDLLLSNPPYLRQERLDPATKGELQTRFHGCVGRGADLSAYFILLALEVLRPGGAAVFLTASSWLDVRYGQPLRRVLCREAWPRLVAESATERVFSSAAVNASLTVFTRGTPPAGATTELVLLDGPLARLDGPGRRREVPVDELVGDRVAPRWGARLRAPDAFERLSAHPDLVEMEQLPGVDIGRGRRTGADRVFVLDAARARELGLEPRDLRPLARSPQRFIEVPPRTSLAPVEHLLLRVRDPGRLRESAPLRGYLERAGLHSAGRRPAWDLGDAPEASLLLPVAVHDRYFVVLNDAGWEAHQRFVTVSLEEDDWREELAAVLSSFLVPLGMEVLGRRSLGEGVLDVPPADWRLLSVIDPRSLDRSTRQELRSAWRELATEPPTRLPELQRRPARRRIDDCLGDALGLSNTEVEVMRATALELLKGRLDKAAR